MKVAQLVLSQICAIAVLIVIPAVWLGIAENWKVIFLCFSYLCFFSASIWRVLRYGELVSSNEDKQVRETAGKLASLIAIIGLLGMHWFALYDFSHAGKVSNTVVERLISGVAVVLMAMAIAVSQIAIRTLGKFFDRLAIKSDHRLVTEGIYSAVRHPIYTSYILLFLGYCTMLQSLLSLGLLAVVCVIWFGNRISIEEHMLEERFGEEYRNYCQQTKRLFPYIY